MSFVQVRMAMSDVREFGFPDATVLTVEPVQDNMTFTAFRAVAQEGVDRVLVDWGDETVDTLVPDATTREVTLTHTYIHTGTKRIRIENRLSEFHPSGRTVDPSFSMFQGVINPDATAYMYTHTGARILTRVAHLGSNITNRTLARCMFANTGITTYPTEYGLPLFFPEENANSYFIPAACFLGCGSLVDLTGLPSTCRAVESAAFFRCSSLSDLSAFSSCSNLCHIGGCAFAHCTSLQTLEGLPGLTDGQAVSKILAGRTVDQTNGIAYRDALLEKYSSTHIEHMMYPLGAYAFYRCTSLDDVASFSVSSGPLLPGVFAYTKLTSYPFNRPWTRRRTTSTSYTAKCSISVVPSHMITPVSSGSAYDVTNMTGPMAGTPLDRNWGPSSDMGAISDSEYVGCDQLTQVDLDGIHHVGNNAFGGCTALMRVLSTDKTMDEVRNLRHPVRYSSLAALYPTYPWGLPEGCVVECSDGVLTVEYD